VFHKFPDQAMTIINRYDRLAGFRQEYSVIGNNRHRVLDSI
jgi:hypothetical protein